MAYHILMPLNQSSNQVATVTRHYRLRNILAGAKNTLVHKRLYSLEKISLRKLLKLKKLLKLASRNSVDIFRHPYQKYGL